MPRAGLTPDAVVAEAARIVDDVGDAGLTLAAVARRCGVAVPSLYKHVRGLDDLRGRLATRAARELGAALRRAATGKAGVDAVRAVSSAYRDYAHRHPGCYAYLLRPRLDDEEYQRAAEEILGVLRDVFDGYRIDGVDAVDAARFLRSALHGFVSLETGGGFGMPRSVDRSFERLVAALDHALASWSDQAS